MKRALLLCMLLAAAPLPAFSQGTASAPLGGKLLITGSSAMAPMVEELGKRFRTRHPGVVITVEAGGSERGVADAFDGIAPGSGSIRDGTWPLSRPLNLLTRRVPAGAAKAFIEFALSPAAREVILDHDFVPYLN
jgi:ABC-type phosphate transport system substrate-binding protein